MVKSNRIFATSVAVLCAFCAHDARAAQNAPTFMSKYGEIQSVNKYSSNPFWTPNSPYNQRFPTPIYATGADLNAGDCNRIVGNLVSEYCTGHNYCSNSRLADVRPTVMVQLSQLPGHNFATSCGGYIDSIFENYKKTYGNTSTNNVVKPAQQNVATIQIENPFKQTKSEYEIGVAERAAELESLQKQTTPNAELSATAFPKTIDDLSFTDRVANTTAGYEPYKNLNPYVIPKFETEDEYDERMKSVLTHTITYVGANAPECPKEYLTGRGTTVSCAPTRQNAVCTGWCTDAALTDCQISFTISPNDRDNKTFYAKCTCKDGYDPDGYKCVKPGTPIQQQEASTGGGSFGGGKSSGDSGRWDDDIVDNDANATDEYAIFECRAETIPDVSIIGATSSPSISFGCYKNQPNSIRKCFKNEYQDGHGLVNTVIESITGKVYPRGGFLTEYSANRPIKRFTLNQINSIKNALNELSETDRKKYCYSKGYWMVFFMKKNTDNKWIPIESPFILYDKSWNN